MNHPCSFELAAQIHRAVNSATDYVSDSAQYGIPEHWEPASGHGDTLAALAAEVPADCWAQYSDGDRMEWVRERLGLSPTRWWTVTRNGRRWLVEFAEPQTRAQLQEQVARNRPGEPLELEPALQLAAFRDAVRPTRDPNMQQTTLLPDNALSPTTGNIS